MNSNWLKLLLQYFKVQFLCLSCIFHCAFLKGVMLASEWIVTQHESRVRKVDPEAAFSGATAYDSLTAHLQWIKYCRRICNCFHIMGVIIIIITIAEMS